MKYRFKVIYQTSQLKEVSKMMRQLDQNTGEIGLQEEFEFSGEDKPIPELKEILVKTFEACEVEILFIEGGKIE